MRPNSTPPELLAQNLSAQTEINAENPEMEVWEPPFERWIRLADDLLTRDLTGAAANRAGKAATS